MQWMSDVEQAATTQTPSTTRREASSRIYTAMQLHFLARLQRLSDVRVEIEAQPERDEFMHRLVSRGLFATYQECLDASVGTEARQILRI